ncbi:trypco2 family protein [Leptolyngbya ohadii]|uniref:trypco2 family protein n=1 Tax=Leptolyngbya ohadii TaxID=1962290 RepID=UPI000B599BF9|nr:trypco2 family protein [Leptolyngbya ohadii]
MADNNQRSIGLAELVEQVKRELLSTAPGQTKDAPIFFVESVELELQVTVKREGKAGVKIDVVSIGGGELGGGVSRDDVHKVKVSLSPLFDKKRLMEFYDALHSDQVPKSVKQSLEALFKGNDEDPDAGVI